MTELGDLVPLGGALGGGGSMLALWLWLRARLDALERVVLASTHEHARTRADVERLARELGAAESGLRDARERVAALEAR